MLRSTGYQFCMILLLATGCLQPDSASTPPPSTSDPIPVATVTIDSTKGGSSSEQISQYIRRIFQDRDGNLWFGTTSDGAVRYSDKSLSYFNARNGLGSEWVSSIVQDAQGHLWFGTRDGIARFDGQQFTHYTTKDGLADDHVHCLLIDRKGWLWAATENGVSSVDPSAPLRTDGKKFSTFPIPAADLSKFPYQEGPKRINWMIEDKDGHIWFATNGGGVYRFDGKTLTNISEKEGLCDNFVLTIMEDRKGDLWFGTRHGGVCLYDGKKFETYSRQQLHGDDVSSVYLDRNGTVWIGVTRIGLSKYEKGLFTNFTETDGSGIRVIFCALEDAEGQLWFGTGEGVYRLVGGAFANWTKADALGAASQ